MKRFPKLKGIEESLTDRQRAKLYLISKHSKKSLAVALSVVTSSFSKSEMDHVYGLLESIDVTARLERDHKTLKKYGAAL